MKKRSTLAGEMELAEKALELSLLAVHRKSSVAEQLLFLLRVAKQGLEEGLFPR